MDALGEKKEEDGEGAGAYTPPLFSST